MRAREPYLLDRNTWRNVAGAKGRREITPILVDRQCLNRARDKRRGTGVVKGELLLVARSEQTARNAQASDRVPNTEESVYAG
jgi:hypothetical protein